jgi:hypothetical protein
MVKNACAALVAACLCLSFYSERSDAAGETNLLTVCTSATTTTQASKCTAWQYNVYSPTAYLESFPQVSPGPAGLTDPAYEYRLGSTITPTMGVKVCPTALTPGISFKSEAADPCPNNKLVAASTVIPTSRFAIATNAGGIVVYQISSTGVDQVPGGPFLPSPIPQGSEGTLAVAPSLTATDPTGQFLYAFYDASGQGSDASVYSYKLVNGVPHQVSIGPQMGGLNSDPESDTLLVTAQHVYVDAVAGEHRDPFIDVLTTNDGVLTLAFMITSGPVGGELNTLGVPVGFAVDSEEKFLYWYWTDTFGPPGPANNVAIFSLDFASSSATLITVVPTQGKLTLVK